VDRREQVAQVVAVLGLLWIVYVFGYYLFAPASESTPLVSPLLRLLGLR